MWADSGTILLGCVLLLFGTDSLTNGVSGLIVRKPGQSWLFALSSTSLAALAPLIAIAIAALLLNHADLGVGAALGGAIAQLGIMLGLAALSAPLLARLKPFARINPILIGAVALVWALGLDHTYSRIDGGILLFAFAALAALIVRGILRERTAIEALCNESPRAFATSLLLLRVLVGAVLLGLGAWRLLVGTSGLAASLALNPLILGLLVLGPASALAGASTALMAARQARHLAISGGLMAARRGRGDFALAQALLGALAAILLVLGGLALTHPLALPASIGRFELPVLFTLAVAVYPMMRSDGELSRREGVVLVLAWLAFLATELWLTFA